jgi:hypothetical protein
MFAIFLGVGLLICFLGRTLFKPILFIAGMMLAIGVIMLLFYSTFLKNNTKVWVGWVVLAGSVILGLIVGCCLIKLSKIGAFVLAAWGGFSLALLIYNSFMYKMDSTAGFWCWTIGLALVCGILSLFFFDHILICSTALLGSFMAIYGIGLVAGHYQNPFTIATLLKNHELTSIDPIFYAYLAGNLVLFVLGAGFQYRQRRNDSRSGHDPYNRLKY